MHDFHVWPTRIPSYGRLVRSQLGAATDDHYRYWWADKAPHHKQVIDATGFSWLIDFEGITAQALRDVVTWVETGVAPSPTTKCEWIDGGLHQDQDPAQRGGVQPLIWATANDAVRADVKVGEAVTFVGTAAQPVGTGSIVFARWDFDNDGAYQVKSKVEGDTERVEAVETRAFEAPGTYFVNFRVGGHRSGSTASPPYAENMTRVRVVVT